MLKRLLKIIKGVYCLTSYLGNPTYRSSVVHSSGSYHKKSPPKQIQDIVLIPAENVLRMWRALIEEEPLPSGVHADYSNRLSDLTKSQILSVYDYLIETSEDLRFKEAKAIRNLERIVEKLKSEIARSGLADIPTEVRFVEFKKEVNFYERNARLKEGAASFLLKHF